MEVLNHTLAIDFGTSNSSVYLFKNHSEVLCDQTGSYLFPSYVEYSKNNIITGFAAKRNIGKSGKYVVSCVKRLIGLTYEEYELLDEKNIFGCEVVRGDDGFPFKIYPNSTEGGYNYYSHWHNELEIIYVLKGEILATYNSNQRTLHQGDVLFINKGDVHNLYDCAQ